VRTPGRETVQGINLTNGPRNSKGIPTEVESAWFPISGCSFQPLTSAEQTGNMDLTITLWRLYAPATGPASTLTATSRVFAYGTKYQVFGDPQVWTDARGHPDHFVCELRKASG